MERFTISADENMSEVIAAHPEVATVLMDIGMGCIYCPASQAESIGEACAVHGIDADALVEYVNGDYQDELEEREKLRAESTT